MRSRIYSACTDKCQCVNVLVRTVLKKVIAKRFPAKSCGDRGRGVGRAGLTARHLQWSRSRVAGGRLSSHEFERGEIQISGAFREIKHLDAHYLVGFVVIENDARGDLFGFDDSGVV